MKVKDLINKLKEYEDFDIEASFCEINDEETGYKALWYRKFDVDIGDIGHSDKKVILDLEEI